MERGISIHNLTQHRHTVTESHGVEGMRAQNEPLSGSTSISSLVSQQIVGGDVCGGESVNKSHSVLSSGEATMSWWCNNNHL